MAAPQPAPGYSQQLWNGFRDGVYDGVVGTLSLLNPMTWVRMAKGVIFAVSHPIIVGNAAYNAVAARPVEVGARVLVGYLTGRAVLGTAAAGAKYASQYSVPKWVTQANSGNQVAPYFDTLSNSFAQIKKLQEKIAAYTRLYDHGAHSTELASTLKKFKEASQNLGTQLGVDITADFWDDLAGFTDDLANAGSWLHTNKHGKALGALNKISGHVTAATDKLQTGLSTIKTALTTQTATSSAVQVGNTAQHLYNGTIPIAAQAAFVAPHVRQPVHVEREEAPPVEDAPAQRLDRAQEAQREIIAERIRLQERLRNQHA